MFVMHCTLNELFALDTFFLRDVTGSPNAVAPQEWPEPHERVVPAGEESFYRMTDAYRGESVDLEDEEAELSHAARGELRPADVDSDDPLGH